MSARLSGTGVGDLIVDRERALAWAETAMASPGVHLLVADQGFGARVVVEHCRRMVPAAGVGRCHTGLLVPAMSPFLEAFDLPWPRLADPVGFDAVVDDDGLALRPVPWSEDAESLLARLGAVDDGRPLVLLDGHEAVPSAVEVVVRLAREVADGRSGRSVFVVAQPWQGRGHRVDWFDAIVPFVQSRFDLAAAGPDEAWAWFEAATAGLERPGWLSDAASLSALTRGVPFLVGAAADPSVWESGPSAVFDLGVRVRRLGPSARRVAALVALADLAPVVARMIDRSTVERLVAGPVDDAVYAELAVVGLIEVADDGVVRLTDPMWADGVLAVLDPAERRDLQVRLLEWAVGVGVPPAVVSLHLADVGWSVDHVAERLERAVLRRSPPGGALARLQWLDLLEQERPAAERDDPATLPARLGARLECFSQLERPSVGALTAIRVDAALRSVEAHPGHRARRAMAYGRLVQGDLDRAIVELLDLREEVGRGQAWSTLTADLAMVYLISGRLVLSERSALDAWSDLRAEPAVRAAVGTVLACVRMVRGDLASASAVCDEATVMLDLLDRPPVSPLPVHLLAAMVRFTSDRHAETLRLLEDGIAAAHTHGTAWALAGHRGLAARLWLRQGRLATAERAATAASGLSTGSDGFRTEGWWAGVLGWLEWLRGDDPTAWLMVGASDPVGTVRVGSEVLALVSAWWAERSGGPDVAAGRVAEMFEATLGIGAVSALSEALPTAARLAVVTGDERLRQLVVRVLDIRSSGAVEVPSRRAEQWAARAWLDADIGRMRAAVDRADGPASVLLAAELASDGELLGRRLRDAEARRWFAGEATSRWSSLGLSDVARARAERVAGD